MARVKKSKRLQPVLQLKQQAERKEARKLADLQQNLAAAKRQELELNKYLDEYFSVIKNQQSQIHQASQLGLYQVFITRLQQAIKNQSEQVKQREAAVKNQSIKWAEANANLKAMADLINKSLQLELQEENKKDQKIQDDRYRPQKYFD